MIQRWGQRRRRVGGATTTTTTTTAAAKRVESGGGGGGGGVGGGGMARRLLLVPLSAAVLTCAVLSLIVSSVAPAPASSGVGGLLRGRASPRGASPGAGPPGAEDAVAFGGRTMTTTATATTTPPRPHSLRRRLAGRFPTYGTPEFDRECNWTLAGDPPTNGCVMLARPHPQSNEGLALWSGGIAMAYLASLRSGCRFKFDYGPGVDVSRAVVPHPGGDLDWSVPNGFECEIKRGCFEVYPGHDADWWHRPFKHVRMDPGSLPDLPKYRTAAHGGGLPSFPDLEAAVPGLHANTSMACAFNRMLELSPSASELVPDLYTKIVPALRDEDTLVIALYIRADHADILADREKGVDRADKKIGKFVTNHIDCAIKLEGERLSGGGSHSDARRVVWMLVTDSPGIRDYVLPKYHRRGVTKGAGGEIIERTILVTKSRGAHTRPLRSPQTADFAEAMIDWMLIGESDLVVAGGMYSFGVTAAMRTARPVYDGFRGCVRRSLFN